jgi:hypothetical protein
LTWNATGRVPAADALERPAKIAHHFSAFAVVSGMFFRLRDPALRGQIDDDLSRHVHAGLLQSRPVGLRWQEHTVRRGASDKGRLADAN